MIRDDLIKYRGGVAVDQLEIVTGIADYKGET